MSKNLKTSAIRKAENLAREMVENKLSCGEDTFPSEWELSKELGISRSSVHQALELLVREKLVYRIPGKGTFVSHSFGNGGRIKGKKIGVILPNMHIIEKGAETFWFNFHDIFDGITSEAHVYGADSQLCVCRPDMTHAEAASWLRDNFLKNSIGGMAVINSSGYDTLIREALREKIPVAAWQFDSSPYDRVTADYFPAMQEAVSSLLKRGRRKIVFLGRENMSCGADAKFRGYLEALEGFGLKVDEKRIIKLENYSGFVSSAISDLLGSGVKFDAVAALNDLIAMDAVYALRENGISVPDDVAVTGSDDMPGSDEFDPPLATLKVPRFQIGRFLFQLVKNRIIEPAAEPTVITVGAQFILRESAGRGVGKESLASAAADYK